MNLLGVQRSGYSFHLVNIDCMPGSDHFNIVMELEHSVEELLPYLAAELPACTYTHGTRVINWMDHGHIVAIHPLRITVTDVGSIEEGKQLCQEWFGRILDVRTRRNTISPVFTRRPSVTVLDIFRMLPGTNCGLCRSPTCLAFAARVFQRQDEVLSCPAVEKDKEKHRRFLDQLQANGYHAP